MVSRSGRRVLFVAAFLLIAGTAAAQTHRIGVFFDENAAQVCNAEVTNNAPPVQAYIYALVPDGTVVNGGLFSLTLPSGFQIRDPTGPKDSILDGTLVSTSGLNVTLQKCPVAAGPVLLLSFELYQFDPDLDPGARVPDIRLELAGGATDSLDFERPQIKICDSEDPINGDPTLAEGASIVTTLNCSSDCPCTTPLARRTWTNVKKLFRGR